MNRAEFMRQLERLLQDISENERLEALEYYNNYFEDAGPENEAKVIQELGSPGKVAAIIKADLAGGQEEFGEYTERGYEDARVREDVQVPGEYRNTGRGRRGYRPRKRRNANVILLIILLVFASPILLGVGGGIVGIVFGILGGIIGLLFGIFGIVLAGIVGGAGVLISGIVKCFTSPAMGLVGIGIGSLGIALGFLFLVVLAWMGFKVFPWFIRKISDGVQKISHKVKDRRQGGEQL